MNFIQIFLKIPNYFKLFESVLVFIFLHFIIILCVHKEIQVKSLTPSSEIQKMWQDLCYKSGRRSNNNRTKSRNSFKQINLFPICLSSLLNSLLNKRYILLTITLMLCIRTFDLCAAKASSISSSSHHNEDYNTVRHHHQHLSRQPRQQRDPNSNEEKGYCAPYNGKICKNFISHQVWYSREDPTGGWKNEQITTALWEELIGDLTGLCRTAAEVCVD